MTKEQYKKEWNNCTKCPLHKGAMNHVLFRGSIPADVLLVGEAPGKTEDRLGKPFIGRSGQLLTTAIQRLGLTSYCITNVVCCIPWQSEDHQKIRVPSKEEADSCSPHLTQLFDLCKPRLVALLGEQAKKYFKGSKFMGTPVVTFRHPAYILRKGGEDSLEFKRFLDVFSTSLSGYGIIHTNPFQAIETY